LRNPNVTDEDPNDDWPRDVPVAKLVKAADRRHPGGPGTARLRRVRERLLGSSFVDDDRDD
jgi:hypothetical protein